MNKLVGTCNRELPFVQQLIQTTQLNESLNQREFALDNKLRLIYKMERSKWTGYAVQLTIYQ